MAKAKQNKAGYRPSAEEISETLMTDYIGAKPTDLSAVKTDPVVPTPMDLCREASNKLNSTTEKTMQTAQKLFEQGLITYHRTDNHNLSENGIQLVRDALIARGHETDLPTCGSSRAFKRAWR